MLRWKHTNKKKNDALTIIRGLSKLRFSRDLPFVNENECAICWNEYVEVENISQLKCNPNHYFHT